MADTISNALSPKDSRAYSSVASTSSLKSSLRLSFANAVMDLDDSLPIRISLSIFAKADEV